MEKVTNYIDSDLIEAFKMINGYYHTMTFIT